jgi:hypothetical protein
MLIHFLTIKSQMKLFIQANKQSLRPFASSCGWNSVLAEKEVIDPRRMVLITALSSVDLDTFRKAIL